MKLRILAVALCVASPSFAQVNPGTSPLSIAKGGTSAATAAAARTALGLLIGTNVQAWDADLDAVAALACTGAIVRTASNTVTCRTITGTAAEITVTNGDGVTGIPTLSLPAALTFTGKTVTGGTFNSPALVTPALGTPASGVATNLTGTAAGLTAGTATNAVNSAITNDTTTNATMFPAWVTANTGNLPLKVTSTKLSFNPSTGILSSTGFAGSGAGLTAVSLTAGVTGTLPFANGGTNDTGTAPSTFTPTPVCGTAVFTVNTAKQKLIAAKITWIELDITITTLGTCTNTITFTVPSTPSSSGSLSGRESVATGNLIGCGILSGSTTASCSMAGAGTPPSGIINFTVNMRMALTGTYESP